ncbi:pantetheine-phosphate adenylyltransferase [Thermosulfuriphilus sp.]
MKERIAIYPGTFDPITNGHLDVIQRAVRLFDRLIVAIGLNPAKKPLFSLEERLEMIRHTVSHIEKVEVDYFQGLLVEYAREKEACAVIRGLRAVSDFEYEFQIALMNRKLCPEIETVFLMPGARWIFISSSIIKEVARFGGCLDGLVPEFVKERLKERLSARCPGEE